MEHILKALCTYNYVHVKGIDLPPKTSQIPEMKIRKDDIRISAPKDWDLAASILSNMANNGPIVMISAAAGVPHYFYANFARYLVEHGAHAVITYDYRGMGQSGGNKKRWADLRMKDWALLDFVAVANHFRHIFPKKELVGLGHSYGGQALGLSGISDQFSRYATVATMSGYWRDLDTPYSVWFKTQIIGRTLARVLGYAPKALSVGEAFPGPVLIDWANWIRQPDYFFSDPDLPETKRYEDVQLPLLSVGLHDDPWGNETAIDKFMSRYTNAELRQHWIAPSSSGAIGHLGYFSRKHEVDHWPTVADFVLSGKWPGTA